MQAPGAGGGEGTGCLARAPADAAAQGPHRRRSWVQRISALPGRPRPVCPTGRDSHTPVSRWAWFPEGAQALAKDANPASPGHL